MKKKGNILTENVIFIVLNVTFLTIMVIFIFMKMNSDSVSEEMYAKKIALLIDAAKPGMIIEFNMKDSVKDAEENGLSNKDIISIDGNVVTVKFKEDGGYSYSFFNDVNVEVDVFPSDSSKQGIARISIEND